MADTLSYGPSIWCVCLHPLALLTNQSDLFWHLFSNCTSYPQLHRIVKPPRLSSVDDRPWSYFIFQTYLPIHTPSTHHHWALEANGRNTCILTVGLRGYYQVRRKWSHTHTNLYLFAFSS
jgi:hypothetical protein